MGFRFKAVAAVLVVGFLAGCNEHVPGPGPGPATSSDPAAPPVGVALAVGGLPGPIQIGVVAPPLEGEGSEYRAGAEGAAIAAYRVNLAGGQVSLVTALDDGSAQGATGAVSTLIGRRVSAIVMAATGDHTTAAVTAAQTAGIPVISPYGTASTAGVGGAGVWSIAPSSGALSQSIATALHSAHANRPMLINAVGRSLGGGGRTWVTTTTLDDPGTLAASAVASFSDRTIDSLVVNASAADQVALVAAVQVALGAQQMPMILTPEALTPTFSTGLASAGATSAWLFTAGTNTVDQAALTHGTAADHVAGFLNALTLAIGDPTCRNIYADDACGVSASAADIASHDAVVAIVKAVAKAGSTDPSAVKAALTGLAVTPDDGLAGPSLDFTTASALPTSAVVVLQASTIDPGLRPTSAGSSAAPRLYWFSDVGQ